jgi:hypothetical protein
MRFVPELCPPKRTGLLTTSTGRCGSLPGTACRGNGGTPVCALYRGSVLKVVTSNGLDYSPHPRLVWGSSSVGLQGQWRYFGMRTVPGLGSSIRAGLLTTSTGRCRGFPVTACRGSGGTSVCALYRGSVQSTDLKRLSKAGVIRCVLVSRPSIPRLRHAA